MTDTGTLDVRPMREADLPDVLQLLQLSLAGGPTGERTEDFFTWKHERSPFGPSPAWVATDGERLAGFRIFMRWSFRCGEQDIIHAVRAVDTATHPDYRGRGVFRDLTTTAVAALGDDVRMIFNTPNANSLPGYLKMGWQPVGTIPISLRPLRPLRVARRARAVRSAAPGSATAGAACPLPDAADVLASAEVAGFADRLAALPPAGSRLGTVRDHAYLTWRYGRAPGLDYRAVVLDGARGVRGLAIGRPRRRGDLVELTLSEVITEPGDRRSVRDLLRAVARSGADHVTVHIPTGTPARSELLRCGYLPLPAGPTLVARPLRPMPVQPTDLDAWALSLGDVEVF